MIKNRAMEIILPDSKRAKNDMLSIRKAAIIFGVDHEEFNFKTIGATKLCFNGPELETLKFVKIIDPIANRYFKGTSLVEILFALDDIF